MPDTDGRTELDKLTPDEYRKFRRMQAEERRRQRALSHGEPTPRAKNINWGAELAAAMANQETAIRVAERLGCSDAAVRQQAKNRGIVLVKYLRVPTARNARYALDKTKEKAEDSRLGPAFAMSAQRYGDGLTALPLGIYVIEEVGGQYCKVGIASDGEKRLTQLGLGNPRDLRLVMFKPVPNPRRTEYAAHSKLWTRRHRSEWFRVSGEEAAQAVEAALGIVSGLGDDSFHESPLGEEWSPSHAQFDEEAA